MKLKSRCNLPLPHSLSVFQSATAPLRSRTPALRPFSLILSEAISGCENACARPGEQFQLTCNELVTVIFKRISGYLKFCPNREHGKYLANTARPELSPVPKPGSVFAQPHKQIINGIERINAKRVVKSELKPTLAPPCPPIRKHGSTVTWILGSGIWVRLASSSLAIISGYESLSKASMSTLYWLLLNLVLRRLRPPWGSGADTREEVALV